MKTRDRDIDKPTDYARRSHRHGGLAFMTAVTFLLSILSLLVSGFLAYRFLNLQAAFSVIDNALKQQPVPNGSSTQPAPIQAPNQAPNQAPTQSTPLPTQSPTQPTQSP